MRRFVAYGPAFVVLLTVVVVLLAGPAAVRRLGSAQTEARIVLAQRALDDDDILERINRAARGVAESVRPSVVHLEVTPARGSRRGPGRATGSGWVYDGGGHIITNAHVVRGADRISVQFADGRVAEAEDVGGAGIFLADPYTDIAVLKVDPDAGTFPVRRATGVQPQQGDRVFVFGSPFGFKFSMSEGIVSGLGRDAIAAVEFGGFTNFIQTDAAVNPGNSGGPLVDIKGRVIGMNVAIATGRESQGTTEGQSAGISFAIPLGTIESVVDQLITRGRVARGFLGISWQGGDDPLVYEPSIRGTGFRVATVLPDGPADRAGIRPGDLITTIAGQPVTGSEVLRSVVTAMRPGEQIAVNGLRQREPREFTVTLGEYPPEDLARTAAAGALVRYGLLMADTRRGPVVADVINGSAAAEAGFADGQLIQSVGGTAVSRRGDVYLNAAEHGLLLGRAVPFVVAQTDEASGTSETKTIEVRTSR
ncbi:MAG: trypsin-like peptidase domain-containing protein [Phycisphaerales bacterium]